MTLTGPIDYDRSTSDYCRIMIEYYQVTSLICISCRADSGTSGRDIVRGFVGVAGGHKVVSSPAGRGVRLQAQWYFVEGSFGTVRAQNGVLIHEEAFAHQVHMATLGAAAVETLVVPAFVLKRNEFTASDSWNQNFTCSTD